MCMHVLSSITANLQYQQHTLWSTLQLWLLPVHRRRRQPRSAPGLACQLPEQTRSHRNRCDVWPVITNMCTNARLSIIATYILYHTGSVGFTVLSRVSAHLRVSAQFFLMILWSVYMRKWLLRINAHPVLAVHFKRLWALNREITVQPSNEIVLPCMELDTSLHQCPDRRLNSRHRVNTLLSLQERLQAKFLGNHLETTKMWQ